MFKRTVLNCVALLFCSITFILFVSCGETVSNEDPIEYYNEEEFDTVDINRILDILSEDLSGVDSMVDQEIYERFKDAPKADFEYKLGDERPIRVCM